MEKMAQNKFEFSLSNLDSTFTVETSDEVKQPKKEIESPKMLDSNNNSPIVLPTKSNLPVPTSRVLRSTPKKNISNLPVPTTRVLRSTPKKNLFAPGTRESQARQETNGSAVANGEYSFQLGDPVWAKMKVIF